MSISLTGEFEIYEIVNACSVSNSKRLLSALLNRMRTEEIREALIDVNKSELGILLGKTDNNQPYVESEYNNALFNLYNRYLSISYEDMSTIIEISKKY